MELGTPGTVALSRPRVSWARAILQRLCAVPKAARGSLRAMPVSGDQRMRCVEAADGRGAMSRQGFECGPIPMGCHPPMTTSTVRSWWFSAASADAREFGDRNADRFAVQWGVALGDLCRSGWVTRLEGIRSAAQILRGAMVPSVPPSAANSAVPTPGISRESTRPDRARPAARIVSPRGRSRRLTDRGGLAAMTKTSSPRDPRVRHNAASYAGDRDLHGWQAHGNGLLIADCIQRRQSCGYRAESYARRCIPDRKPGPAPSCSGRAELLRARLAVQVPLLFRRPPPPRRTDFCSCRRVRTGS
jgi:hypothetical protein